MADKLKRDNTIEQFKLMKRIIANEKKVSRIFILVFTTSIYFVQAQELLKERISTLDQEKNETARMYNSMLA